MRLAIAVFLLFSLHFSTGVAKADEDCTAQSPEEMKHMMEATRDVEVIEVRRAAETIPPASLLKGDDRSKFEDRFKQVARAFWDTTEHQKKVTEFLCGKIRSGEFKPTKETYVLTVKELMKESKAERQFWLCAAMKKLETEFPQFETPEAQLALGELYARNARWDYAHPSFGKVLKVQPQNGAALEWDAAVTFNEKTILDPKVVAEELVAFRKVVAVEPDSAEAHYWVGAIDWTGAFNDLQKRLHDYELLGGKTNGQSDAFPDQIRREFVAADGAMIDEGIAQMQAALKISPDFGEARAYLMLLYQLKVNAAAATAEQKKYAKLAEDLRRGLNEFRTRAPRPGRPQIPPPPPPPGTEQQKAPEKPSA